MGWRLYGGVDTATPAPRYLERVSAWVTYLQLGTEREVMALSARARALGLDGLEVMLGPQPKLSELDVTFRDRKKMERAIEILKADGLQVGVTTWLAPTDPWIDALKGVGELAEKHQVPVCLDAEESWTIPLRQRGQKTAALWAEKATSAVRSECRQQLECTHIVYGNRDVLIHLLQRCDVSIPQSQATAKSWRNRAPGSLEKIAVARWSDPKQRWKLELSLAAFGLVGAYGAITAERALEYSLRASVDLGITSVRYWQWSSLSALSPRCHAVIRRFRHPGVTS